MLGVGRIHIERDYDEHEDFVKVINQCSDGGKREQIMFTEQGLYHVVSRSNSDIGKKFRRFVTVVMRELRLRGQVTLTDALQKLEQLEGKVKRLDNQLEEEHEKLLYCEKEKHKFWQQSMDQKFDLERLKQRAGETLQKYGADQQLDIIKTKLFKPVYMYRVRAPKNSDIEDTDSQDLDVNDDQDVCFEIGTKKRIADHIAELRVMPGVGIERIQTRLDERNFHVLVEKKPYKSVYWGTIEQVRDILDEFTVEQSN